VPPDPRKPRRKVTLSDVTAATAHHEGHRERLLERFVQGGGAALQDYELLELILFMVIPRQDVKERAKTLLALFGGFAGVFAAPPERLQEVKGIGPKAAQQLKVLQAMALRLMRSDILHRPALTSWRQLLDYCTAAMAHNATEEFRVLFLDTKNTLIADEVQSRGTVNQAPVYPREVVKRALELGASAIILVHNHPSGDPTPSRDDVAMTKAIVEAARPLNIVVHDHLVIARNEHASLKGLGLM